MIATVPSRESYVILGDFNARVGSRVGGDDVWASERGPHGLGVANDAGMELLSFLSSHTHQATICNTWFEKKDIHKQTWQHPRSKQWSCIDFIVVMQKDRKLCQDVTVKRGAVCNTDHHLVVATSTARTTSHLSATSSSYLHASSVRSGTFRYLSYISCPSTSSFNSFPTSYLLVFVFLALDL